MQWAGLDGKEELYALRPIIPESRLIILEKLGRQKPLILNSREDLNVFLIYSGTAFASHQVCKECMPYLLRPGTVKNKARKLWAAASSVRFKHHLFYSLAVYGKSCGFPPVSEQYVSILAK